mgnify:CR=1 FL=1
MPGVTKVACPFASIERIYIPVNALNESAGSQVIETLVVTADLKNVRCASDDEQRKSKTNVRTITMEIITQRSIQELLNKSSSFGIVSSAVKRHCDVCSCSLTHLWAEQVCFFVHTQRDWFCRVQIIVIGFANDAEMAT